jgi:hypothetical protein
MKRMMTMLVAGVLAVATFAKMPPPQGFCPEGPCVQMRGPREFQCPRRWGCCGFRCNACPYDGVEFDSQRKFNRFRRGCRGFDRRGFQCPKSERGCRRFDRRGFQCPKSERGCRRFDRRGFQCPKSERGCRGFDRCGFQCPKSERGCRGFDRRGFQNPELKCGNCEVKKPNAPKCGKGPKCKGAETSK